MSSTYIFFVDMYPLQKTTYKLKLNILNTLMLNSKLRDGITIKTLSSLSMRRHKETLKKHRP